MELKDSKVAIVGMGLMGGSLAMALHGKTAALFAVDSDPDALNLALELGVVDRASTDPAKILQGANIIILAIPVNAILQYLGRLEKLTPGSAIVFDLGSTKNEVLQKMSALPDRFDPIGGHPMCGKETHSLEHAEGKLYKDAPFALVSLPRTTSEAKRTAQEIVITIGAHPIWLEPLQHDEWVAATSHLPYLIANTLAHVTPLEAAGMIGPGFRSAARMAVKQRSMMVDILETNRVSILHALELFQNQLALLKDLLQSEDYDLLKEELNEGAMRYTSLFEKNKEAGKK